MWHQNEKEVDGRPIKTLTLPSTNQNRKHSDC